MLIQLLLSHHLKEDFHSTAYSINVYVLPGPQAIRLTRLSREAVEGGAGQRIEWTFLKKTGRITGKSKRKDSGIQAKSPKDSSNSSSPLGSALVPKRKTKKRRRLISSDDGQDSDSFNDDITHTQAKSHAASLEAEPRRCSPSMFNSPNPDGNNYDTWTFTLADVVPATKRRRKEVPNSGPGSDDEVVVLSD